MTPTPIPATGERRTPRAHAPRAHAPAAGPLPRPAAQAVDHPDRPDFRAPARETCPECADPWVYRAEGCLFCPSRGWSACGA